MDEVSAGRMYTLRGGQVVPTGDWPEGSTFRCPCCADVGHHHVTGRHRDPATGKVDCRGDTRPCACAKD